MATVEPKQPRIERRPLPHPGVLLVLGILVIPAVIVASSIDDGVAPDAAAYVRMSFATVAGSTIAVCTAFGVLLTAVVRRSSAAAIITLVVISLLTASIALSTIGSQAATLVRVLSASG